MDKPECTVQNLHDVMKKVGTEGGQNLDKMKMGCAK
jgi:hypothetical protein